MEKAITIKAFDKETNQVGWMVKILLNPPSRKCKYLPQFFDTKKDAERVAKEFNSNQKK